MNAGLVCVAMLITAACTRNAHPVPARRDVPATASVDDRVRLAACPADMRIVSASRVYVNGREVDCAELALTSRESTSGALITVECGRALKQSGGNAGACIDRAFPSVAIDMTMPTQPSTPSEPPCVVEIAVFDDGAVTVGGRAAPQGQSGLIDAMRALCSAENARVVITSSRDVPYGRLMEILDALRAAGFGMISFRSDRAAP